MKSSIIQYFSFLAISFKMNQYTLNQSVLHLYFWPRAAVTRVCDTTRISGSLECWPSCKNSPRCERACSEWAFNSARLKHIQAQVGQQLVPPLMRRKETSASPRANTPAWPCDARGPVCAETFFNGTVKCNNSLTWHHIFIRHLNIVVIKSIAAALVSPECRVLLAAERCMTAFEHISLKPQKAPHRILSVQSVLGIAKTWVLNADTIATFNNKHNWCGHRVCSV